jgi:hypothetical protein
MEQEKKSSGGNISRAAESDEPASPSEREMIFYYNREHRLARASPAVQALNEQKAPFRNTAFSPSMIRPLVILFGTIVFLTVTGFIIGTFSDKDEGKKLGGNSITVEAMRYKGATYIALKKTYSGNENVYTGTVDIAISPRSKDAESAPISTERIFFSFEESEEYRFSVPYEAPELLILLRAETEMVSLMVRAD